MFGTYNDNRRRPIVPVGVGDTGGGKGRVALNKLLGGNTSRINYRGAIPAFRNATYTIGLH